jgi:hypothetical protein
MFCCVCCLVLCSLAGVTFCSVFSSCFLWRLVLVSSYLIWSCLVWSCVALNFVLLSCVVLCYYKYPLSYSGLFIIFVRFSTLFLFLQAKLIIARAEREELKEKLASPKDLGKTCTPTDELRAWFDIIAAFIVGRKSKPAQVDPISDPQSHALIICGFLGVFYLIRLLI